MKLSEKDLQKIDEMIMDAIGVSSESYRISEEEKGIFNFKSPFKFENEYDEAYLKIILLTDAMPAKNNKVSKELKHIFDVWRSRSPKSMEDSINHNIIKEIADGKYGNINTYRLMYVVINYHFVRDLIMELPRLTLDKFIDKVFNELLIVGGFWKFIKFIINFKNKLPFNSNHTKWSFLRHNSRQILDCKDKKQIYITLYSELHRDFYPAHFRHILFQINEQLIEDEKFDIDYLKEIGVPISENSKIK